MSSSPRIVVWFSCGAASAVAAKLATERYGKRCKVVYCDTMATEHSDNQRFFSDVEQWIGKRIRRIKSTKFEDVDDVFEKTRYMAGIGGARCTAEMKKIPRFEFQRADDVHIFGFTADEKDRIELFEQNNPELELEWILRDEGIKKEDCYRIIQEAGIQLPALYALGYKNNNCLGCVKATSARYWNMTRRDFPEVFEKRARQSRELGVRLTRYKGERIFLDELPTDYLPAEPLEDISCGPDCGVDYLYEMENKVPELKDHPAPFNKRVLEGLKRIATEHAVAADKPKLKILDPFAGSGRIHELREFGHFTKGVELEPEWANHSRYTEVGDATKLRFADNSFDVTFTSPCFGNRMKDSHNAQERCKECGATGKVGRKKCPKCDGKGKRDHHRRTYTHYLGRKPSENSAAVMGWGPEYRHFHKKALQEMIRVTTDLVVINMANHLKTLRKGEPAVEQRVTEWWLWQMLKLGLNVQEVVPIKTPKYRYGENNEVRTSGEFLLVMRQP